MSTVWPAREKQVRRDGAGNAGRPEYPSDHPESPSQQQRREHRGAATTLSPAAGTGQSTTRAGGRRREGKKAIDIRLPPPICLESLGPRPSVGCTSRSLLKNNCLPHRSYLGLTFFVFQPHFDSHLIMIGRWARAVCSSGSPSPSLRSPLLRAQQQKQLTSSTATRQARQAKSATTGSKGTAPSGCYGCYGCYCCYCCLLQSGPLSIKQGLAAGLLALAVSLLSPVVVRQSINS
jgi:hypothetical protein